MNLKKVDLCKLNQINSSNDFLYMLYALNALMMIYCIISYVTIQNYHSISWYSEYTTGIQVTGYPCIHRAYTEKCITTNQWHPTP